MTIEIDNMRKHQKASTKWHSHCKRKEKWRKTRWKKKIESTFNLIRCRFNEHADDERIKVWIYAYISYYDLYFRRCTPFTNIKRSRLSHKLLNYRIDSPFFFVMFAHDSHRIEHEFKHRIEPSREWRDRLLLDG